MSIWRSFVLIFLPLTFIVPMLVWFGLTQQQQTLQAVISERDEQTARTMAAAINEQLNGRADLVRGVAEQAAVSDDIDLLMASVGVLDTQFDGGMAIFSLAGVPLAVRGVTRDAVIDWPVPVSPANPFSPVLPDAYRRPTMLVTAINETVQVVGAFDPALLIEDALNTENEIALLVVDDRNQVIYASGLTLDATELSPQSLGIDRALAGSTGTLASTTADASVLAYTPIDGVSWALLTVEPSAPPPTNGRNALLIAPLIMVPALLLSLGAIWFGDRQIVRPLRQLADKAAALGRGQFGTIDEKVGGIEAIQKLQGELQYMSQRVQTAQDNLRGQVGAITQAQEDERRRLARELHDETIQSLIALNQRVQLAQLRHQHVPELAEMQTIVTAMIGDVRHLTHGLRPVGLEELGLVPAVELLVASSAEKLHTPIELTINGRPRRLDPEHEFAFYRIIQEAINNVSRHADASVAIVTIAFDKANITITVSDDGRGFIVPDSLAEMAASRHFGLLGIYERAQLIGAAVAIQSDTGEGTVVEVTSDEYCEGV